MKPKYTPGPWTFSQNWHGEFCINGKIASKADARLIAAAPELFEALEKAYLQILEFLNEGDFKREVVFDAGYIVDALDKARGKK